MALPASDPFTGTGAFSGSWTAIVNSWERSSGVAVPVTIGGENIERWTGDAFGPDHYAQAVVTTAVSSSGGGTGIMVRLDGFGNGYFLRTCLDTADLYKLTGGSSYTLLQNLGATFADGDVAYLEAVGATLVCKKNGVQIGSNQTDSSYTSGSAGLWAYSNDGQMDDFAANSIGMVPGSTIPVLTHAYRQRRVS